MMVMMIPRLHDTTGCIVWTGSDDDDDDDDDDDVLVTCNMQ